MVEVVEVEDASRRQLQLRRLGLELVLMSAFSPLLWRRHFEGSKGL